MTKEEAIEALKEHKRQIDKEYINTRNSKAIETVLADRENLKNRNKELEEERQLVGMPVRNKRDGKLGIVLHQWESGSVAVLENISPRVINTHDNWDTLEIVTDEVKQIKTKQDYIPKSVIKEKIEELNNRIEKYREYTEQGIETDVEWVDNVADRETLSVLEELLEKEK
jgi:3-methyladenine DNA glycosylase AlkD